MALNLEALRRRAEADPGDGEAAADYARALARAGRSEAAYLVLFDRRGPRDDPLLQELAARLFAKQGSILKAIEPTRGFLYAVDFRPVSATWPGTARPWRWLSVKQLRATPLPVQAIRGRTRPWTDSLQIRADLADFLCLRELKFGAKDMRILKSVRFPSSIQRLDLREVGFPDPIRDAFEGLASLRVLLVSKGGVSRRAIQAIAALPALQELRLEQSRLIDRALSGLADLRSLKILSLPDSRITGGRLSELAALTELRKLELSSPLFSDRGLENCGRLSGLEELRVRRCPIYGGGIAALSALPRLRALDLGETRIGDSAAGALTQLTALEELNLCGTDLSERGFARLRELPALKRIYVSESHVSSARRALSGLRHIRISSRV